MKVRFPIVVVDEKEMYEREEAEFLAAQNKSYLEEMAIKSSDEYTTPFEHENDRVVNFVLDLTDIKSFYQTYIHLNDTELEGVRVRQFDGYWPPIFIIPFKKFEEIYIKFHRGELLKMEDEIIIHWEKALEV